MATNQDQFAFGCDQLDGVPCPAVAVGRDSNNEIVRRYDEYIRERTDLGGSGVVRESLAREAWLAAVKSVHDDETGRNVADELGWL